MQAFLEPLKELADIRRLSVREERKRVSSRSQDV